MDESELLFNCFYLLFCMCIIYPPEAFQRMGLTIEQLFSNFLGDEKINFISYHQRRTSLNLFIHSCLPFVYFLIHQFKFSVFAERELEDAELDPDFPMPQEAVAFKTLAWKIAQRGSLIFVLSVPLIVVKWWQQNWQGHPMSQILAKYSNADSYLPVASDISTEFRRNDIYKKKLNPISTVIATQNWIIKTSLYQVNFAHQSDTTLSVLKTETFNVAQDTNDVLQMVSIRVKPNRRDVPDFHIRINALEFRNLEERIRRPITIPANIQFHRNVIDRFIDVFKQQVEKNPIYVADRIVERCFACMITTPNIKINKQCTDVDNNGQNLPTDACCSNCYCRPMWCVDCLARWFAAKQQDNDRETWLQQKCTCPMCRAKFCLLDVSYIQAMPNSEEAESESTDNAL